MLPVADIIAATESLPRLDDDLAAVGIMEAALRAEAGRADAIVVNCMNDPGVDAVRETVTIPVIGAAETSIHLAGHLGASFGVITTSDDDVPVVRELFEHLDASARCRSIRALGLPVSALQEDAEATRRRYFETALDAVRVDGAAVLIAGCTLLSSHTKRITDDLASRGASVPVIDSLVASLHQAVTLVRLGIRHAPATYGSPPPQQLHWPSTHFDALTQVRA